MKRFLKIVCSCLVLILLCGCFINKEQKMKNEKLNIVCTIFPQYDFVRQIAGDLVNLKMLVPYELESHDFSLENLTIADLATVSSADMVIFVGGESDAGWIHDLKETVDNEAVKWIAITDMVDLLENEHSDHEHHEHVFEYDEHVWTSPKQVIKIVNALTDELCQMDEKNASRYRQNSEAYIKSLQELDQRINDTVSVAKQKTLVFADRFAFKYLFEDYGLSFEAAFTGCSTSVDPSVAQIATLNQKATDLNAKVVFYMENSNPVFAENIAHNVGAKTLMLHSCHTVTRKQFNGGVSYLSLMNENIKNISEALG